MAIQLYNTFTRSKQAFNSIEEGVVRMYSCGPTVYARPHIGNFRAFLFADLLRRWLEYRGYEVRHVMNITDVGHLVDDADEGEDKLDAQARRDKLDPFQISARYAAEYLANRKTLGMLDAMVNPKATEHIPEMLEIIRGLLASGHAYAVGGDVYFDVQSFPGYGQLSGNKVEDLEAGARVEVNTDKRHPADFALWKSDAAHLMKWESEFGPDGFPGWHVECSAMARKHLGDQIDIHTGGEDNIFPHHECEIAKTEAFTGERFARYWMHTKFLQVDGGKMGKSLGNAYTIDEVLERGFEARHLRFALLRGHYRSPLNFTWAVMGEAKAFLENLDRMVDDLVRVIAAEAAEPLEHGFDSVRTARAEFEAALDDDLSVPRALAAMSTLRNDFVAQAFSGEPAQAALNLLRDFDRVFGVLRPASTDDSGDARIEELIAARNAARASKQWAESDRIRDELLAEGIALEDGATGTIWRRG